MVGGGAVGLRGSFDGVVVASIGAPEFGAVAIAVMAGMAGMAGMAVPIAIFDDSIWIRRSRSIQCFPVRSFAVLKCLFALLVKKVVRKRRGGNGGSLVGGVFRL